MSDLHIRSGDPATPPYSLDITPASAGWGHASLRVLPLPPAGRHRFATGEEEMVVLPLAGSCEVRCDGERFALTGRLDVFSGISDMVYLPRDASVEITSAGGGRFALAGARCGRRLQAPDPRVSTGTSCAAR